MSVHKFDMLNIKPLIFVSIFDCFLDIESLNRALNESDLTVVDFRGEAITFKVSNEQTVHII